MTGAAQCARKEGNPRCHPTQRGAVQARRAFAHEAAYEPTDSVGGSWRSRLRTIISFRRLQ